MKTLNLAVLNLRLFTQIRNMALLFVTLTIGTAAFASEIPANARVRLRLDCKSKLDGQYSAVKKVVIQDVLYKKAPASWDINNSMIEFFNDRGVAERGEMNGSNGVDPQDYRDSAPSGSNGFGGTALYFNEKFQTVFITRSASIQKNLLRRQYSLWIGLVDSDGNPAKTLAKGTLNCVTR
jgi:hypothetical protein